MTDPASARPKQRVGTRSPRQGTSRSKEELDDWLDEALADTFPASDPIGSPPGLAPVVEAPPASAPPGLGLREADLNHRLHDAASKESQQGSAKSDAGSSEELKPAT